MRVCNYTALKNSDPFEPPMQAKYRTNGGKGGGEGGRAGRGGAQQLTEQNSFSNRRSPVEVAVDVLGPWRLLSSQPTEHNSEL